LTLAVLCSGLLCTVACNDDDPSGEACGDTVCGEEERCCGPPECGFCVPKDSRIACPTTCDKQDGGTSKLDSTVGVKCGRSTCGEGFICCGPPECGQCVPENSGAHCPDKCDDPCQPACDSDQICVVNKEEAPVGQECKALPRKCASDRTCACVGTSVCVGVYNLCHDYPADNTVVCECTSCQVNPP
jgi:hypothetical protein